MNELMTAIRYLASIDDGANKEDEKGFNKYHSAEGQMLARKDIWNDNDYSRAYTLATIYKRQLERVGINVDEIQRPASPFKNTGKNIFLVEGKLIFMFPYDKNFLESFKSKFGPGGVRWDAVAKQWWANDTDAMRLLIEKHAAELGFGTSALPPRQVNAEKAQAEIADRTQVKYYESGNNVYIVNSYPIKEMIKLIAGASFDRFGWKNQPAWVVPVTATSARALMEIAERNNVDTSEVPLLKAMIAKADEARALQTLQDVELFLPNLRPEKQMMPFQRVGVKFAETFGNVIIGDEPGLGKTIQGIASIIARQAFPALIVVPANIRINWQREIQNWTSGYSVKIITGRKKLPLEEYKADFIIIGYSTLAAHAESLAILNLKAIVLDESHTIKTPTAQVTKAALKISSAQSLTTRICLSGTPLLNRPDELIPQLQFLGKLNEFGGRRGFERRYVMGFNARITEDMQKRLTELNEKLKESIMIRRKKMDVLTELPPLVRANVPLSIDNRSEYEKAERMLLSFLRNNAVNFASEEFQDFLSGLPENERHEIIMEYNENAAEKAERAFALVLFSYLRRLTIKGKMASIEEWVENFLDSGEKLILFGWHTKYLKAIAAKFGGSLIIGETPMEKRQKAIDDFQADPNSKLICIGLTAGGVGITLTAGANIAIAELPWRPGDLIQAEGRAHRYTQQRAVTAWYLNAENTVDDRMMQILLQKMVYAQNILDGEIVDTQNMDIFDMLVEEYKKEAGNV